MNKKFFFLLLMLLLLLTSCNNREMKTSTTTFLQVIEKNQSEGKYYITAKNPYDSNAIEVTIDLKDMNVWNLVEEEKIYFGTYYSFEVNSTEGEILSITIPPDEKDEVK